MSRTRTALTAAVALALSVSAPLAQLLVTASPARAEVTVNEVYVLGPGTVLQMEGRGWGHGRGMSQYGALGAASKAGKTADQITAFYYPGTAKGSVPNRSMRVKLSADTDSATEVYAPSSGTALTVLDRATGRRAVLPVSSETTRWRARTASDGLRLEQLVSGAWRAPGTVLKDTAGQPWPAAVAGPLDWYGPSTVRVVLPAGAVPGVGSRAYRGVIRTQRLSATQIMSVNVLPLESYLYGVVPRESPAGWPMEALKAQAIAARSYTQNKVDRVPSTQTWDICDTTACQVYGGYATYGTDGTRLSGEESSTTQAVQSTAGVVRTYNGKAIFAEFSASNGGWTTAHPDATNYPYLKAQPDSWDGLSDLNVHYSWNGTVSTAQLQKRFPAVGTLTGMRVTSRDGNGQWGGRVKTVVLTGRDSAGQATSVTTTGRDVYLANSWSRSNPSGMRSNWWHVVPALNSAVVSTSPAPRLVRSPGTSTGTVTATVKNTGTSTWSTSGLHLALASSPGTADPLVGNSTRPGQYTGTASTVAPGETAAFSFALTGDGVAPGLYSRSYRVRIGSGPAFGAAVSFRVQVDAPVYAGTQLGAVISTSGTAPTGDAPGAVLSDGRSVVVPVGSYAPVEVRVRNDGNITWPDTAGGPVRLGTADPRDRSSPSAGSGWLVGSTRPSSVTASAPVAPGQTGKFGLRLYGNGRPVGVSTEVFQPVWESRSWFSAPSTSLLVVRVDPAVSRLAMVSTAPASALTLTNAPSGTATLSVRLRNLGGSPWNVGSERLSATSTPLATSQWPSATQAPPLARNVSRPSVSTVYPGEVGEWLVPLSAFQKAAGSYPITFQAATPDGAAYGPRMTSTVKVVAATFTASVVNKPGTFGVPRAGSTPVYFDVKNTGNATWPVNGLVRSVAQSGTASRDASWLAATRPGPVTYNLTRRGAPDVRPGEVARFGFRLAGNGRVPQDVTERFGIAWDGWQHVSGFTLSLSYRIV